MISTDGKGLLDFLRRIPSNDRLYLKDDVVSPDVVGQWVKNLNYQRVFPLLAIANGRIVADASLHRRDEPDAKHIAELRITIDPSYRNQGLGRFLLRKLVEIARRADENLEKVYFEIVVDTEQAAEHAARAAGFVKADEFSEYLRYYAGTPHDLNLMVLRLGEAASELTHEPAEYMF
jgi:RimJ/RimL family protein N-acetyltransferase